MISNLSPISNFPRLARKLLSWLYPDDSWSVVKNDTLLLAAMFSVFNVPGHRFPVQ